MSRRSSDDRRSGACWPIDSSGAGAAAAVAVSLGVVARWEAEEARSVGEAKSVSALLGWDQAKVADLLVW